MIVAFSMVQAAGIALRSVYADNSAESTLMQSVLQISPATQSIAAGSYARFSIFVNGTGISNVLLAAQGAPVNSNVIFSPETGVANPQFRSTLSIVTSAETPAGSYDLTVIAILQGQEYSAHVTLGLSSIGTSQTGTFTSSGSLTLGVDTDLRSYEPNSTVTVRGKLTDAAGDGVPGASVSIQVDDPTGVQLVFMNNLTTDAAGVYDAEVKLGANAASGTYTIFVSSSKPGYASTTTHTTFVVGSSSTPSVVISQVYITDTNGNPTGVFSVGQTLQIWVTVQNTGAQFQGIIWVQILDPDGTPESIQLQNSTLATGASVKVEFNYVTSSSLPLGIYTANAFVSDKLISQGGTFLASAKAQFALTKS